MVITEESVTHAVVGTLQAEDERLNTVMASLIRHLHAFVREVEPSEEEWAQGIDYLTRVGQKCNDVRQEFILLSDVLGVTALKDCINNRKPEAATEATVLGPFYREGVGLLSLGDNIARGDGDGEPCLVRGTVKSMDGTPVAGAVLDIWQAASNGLYEQQDSDQPEMNLRGRFATDEQGRFHFRTVKPLYYPVPGDGPVGEMLRAVGRHNFRPAHIHFIITHAGYEPVVTQLFDRQDGYIASDVVFGVKDSLIVDFKRIGSSGLAEEAAMSPDDWLLEYDFVLNPAEKER